jgi:hypothetical protein
VFQPACEFAVNNIGSHIRSNFFPFTAARSLSCFAPSCTIRSIKSRISGFIRVLPPSFHFSSQYLTL